MGPAWTLRVSTCMGVPKTIEISLLGGGGGGLLILCKGYIGALDLRKLPYAGYQPNSWYWGLRVQGFGVKSSGFRLQVQDLSVRLYVFYLFLEHTPYLGSWVRA